ncbi:hypothetical protein FRC05_010399, partial [Tulasnella sp. 425]
TNANFDTQPLHLPTPKVANATLIHVDEASVYIWTSAAAIQPRPPLGDAEGCQRHSNGLRESCNTILATATFMDVGELIYSSARPLQPPLSTTLHFDFDF